MYQMSDTWWCHQMGTFSALLALCEGNPPVTCGFPSQRPVTRSFDVFFDLHLNKRLSKQFETPSRPLWRHCNGYSTVYSRWRTYNTDSSMMIICISAKLIPLLNKYFTPIEQYVFLWILNSYQYNSCMHSKLYMSVFKSTEMSFCAHCPSTCDICTHELTVWVLNIQFYIQCWWIGSFICIKSITVWIYTLLHKAEKKCKDFFTYVESWDLMRHIRINRSSHLFG